MPDKMNILYRYKLGDKYKVLSDSMNSVILKMRNMPIPIMSDNFVNLPDAPRVLDFEVDLMEHDCDYEIVGNVQCRSSDEAFTSFLRCKICNHQKKKD